MIDIVSIILIHYYRTHEGEGFDANAVHQWLNEGDNYSTLTAHGERIMHHYSRDEQYDATRAFAIICKRLQSQIQRERI